MLIHVATFKISDKKTAEKVRAFFAEKERRYKAMSTGKAIPK